MKQYRLKGSLLVLNESILKQLKKESALLRAQVEELNRQIEHMRKEIN